jgi:hypothetical protein
MDQREMTGLPTGAWTRVARRVRRVAMIALPAAGLAVALVGVAPTGQALAQDDRGGSINIGGNIAASVADAVSGIATNSSASGGVQTSHNDLNFGEQEGLAISDASGGNSNVSEKSGK